MNFTINVHLDKRTDDAINSLVSSVSGYKGVSRASIARAAIRYSLWFLGAEIDRVGANAAYQTVLKKTLDLPFDRGRHVGMRMPPPMRDAVHKHVYRLYRGLREIDVSKFLVKIIVFGIAKLTREEPPDEVHEYLLEHIAMENLSGIKRGRWPNWRRKEPYSAL